jgi:hypothetical protein
VCVCSCVCVCVYIYIYIYIYTYIPRGEPRERVAIYFEGGQIREHFDGLRQTNLSSVFFCDILFILRVAKFVGILIGFDRLPNVPCCVCICIHAYMICIHVCLLCVYIHKSA